MTLEEFKKILESDPRFKCLPKSITVTLYKSPLVFYRNDNANEKYYLLDGDKIDVSDYNAFLALYRSLREDVKEALNIQAIEFELEVTDGEYGPIYVLRNTVTGEDVSASPMSLFDTGLLE